MLDNGRVRRGMDPPAPLKFSVKGLAWEAGNPFTIRLPFRRAVFRFAGGRGGDADTGTPILVLRSRQFCRRIDTSTGDGNLAA
jgi:hypothetical protein